MSLGDATKTASDCQQSKDSEATTPSPAGENQKKNSGLGNGVAELR
ncbi:hypothetical protein ACNKHX_00045 [Shigella flexneri]